MEVSFPPNGSTPPHYHPGAFVTGYVVSGYVFNARNEEPMEVKGPGEHFIEHPGCKHRISDNASKTEPAVLIATFVVETEVAEKGVAALVEVVKEYQAAAKEAQERTAAEAEKQN